MEEPNEEEEAEDEETSSSELPMDNAPPAETVRTVAEEIKPEPAIREVHTPPPPPLPPPKTTAKLLPRLGSLDSQFHHIVTLLLCYCNVTVMLSLRYHQVTVHRGPVELLDAPFHSAV